MVIYSIEVSISLTDTLIDPFLTTIRLVETDSVFDSLLKFLSGILSVVLLLLAEDLLCFSCEDTATSESMDSIGIGWAGGAKDFEYIGAEASEISVDCLKAI